jgi:DNA-binding GntR family transcriptional regulator
MANLTEDDVHPRHTMLAQKIVDMAIAGGWTAGQRLTEQDLAGHLDVSRTPVRAALRLLEEHGVVEAGAARGFVLARAAGELHGFALTARRPVEDALHARIIGDRLGGNLGAEPSQADLARRYQVSLPVLRRVFQRLEHEGLVARTGWRWSFRPSLETRQSQKASYQIRLMLEPPTLLLPGFAADTAVLKQVRDDHLPLLCDAGPMAYDPKRIFDLDARFHETLAGFSHNPFIVNVIHQQNALRRLLEVRSYSDHHRVREWCGEHVQILDAVAEDDRLRASSLMRAHLLRADQNLEKSHD